MANRNPEQEWRRTCLISLFCLMEAELNGYALKQRLKKWRIQEYLPISPATIYRALNKLADQGLLSSRSVQRGKYPVSVVFSITEAGKAAYTEWLGAEAEFVRTEYPESVFIGLAAYLPHEERIRLARKRKEAARRHLRALEHRLAHYGENEGKPYAEWLLIDHEIHMVTAQVAWLDRFIGLAEKRKV